MVKVTSVLKSSKHTTVDAQPLVHSTTVDEMLPGAPEKIYDGTDAMEAERLFAQISRAPAGNECRTGRCWLNESRR